MQALKALLIFLALTFLLLYADQLSYGQAAALPVKIWIGQLQAKDDPAQKKLYAIQNKLYKADSIAAAGFFAECKKSAVSGNHHFNARVLYLTAGYLYNNVPSGSPQVGALYAKALNEAYLAADEGLIAYISWEYGSSMEGYQQLELATTYLLNAAELNKKLMLQNDRGQKLARLQYLGELLFHARLYAKSIYYTGQYIEEFRNKPGISPYSILKAWNTMGQDYQKLGNLDSALWCYRRSSAMAAAIRDETWMGINAGFTGQVYFLQKHYDKAERLLKYDYSINKDKDANIAAYSLHWLGRIDMEQGHPDSALWKLRKAVQILEVPSNFRFQNREYREAAYYAIADAYRLNNRSDSFYRYFQLFQSLHDSLQRITVRSSVDLAEMRFENGKNFYVVQLLAQQIRDEELKRNFIIAVILLLSVIVILVLVRQKQKSEYRRRLALQQKAAAEAETRAAEAEAKTANERLHLFAQHMLEKTAIIEKLQHQLRDSETERSNQQLLQEISSQAILTEADWLQFKQMFEKVHGGFFARLKEKSPGITPAEQRMAALTRLYFTNDQIASMLGISVHSVRRTRLRLRNRLGLSADSNLEEVFAAI